MDILKRDDIIAILGQLKRVMEENKIFLVELDGRMGDGDLGLTMSKGFAAAYDEMKETAEDDLGTILSKAGMVIAKTAPSTMGTLMGTGFMRGGKALKGSTEAGVSDLARFLKAFVQGLMDRGKAQPGDKTIIDSLLPAAEALEEAEGENLGSALTGALGAAERGLEATKEMIAKHGRIAYYKEKSRGHQDPGATVGALLIKTIADYVSGDN